MVSWWLGADAIAAALSHRIRTSLRCASVWTGHRVEREQIFLDVEETTPHMDESQEDRSSSVIWS